MVRGLQLYRTCTVQYKGKTYNDGCIHSGISRGAESESESPGVGGLDQELESELGVGCDRSQSR